MKMKKVNWTEYAMLVALIVLIGIFSFTANAFLTRENILNILRQIAIMGICSVGMTMVIITGGIDLSVGSLVGVACVLGASLMAGGMHPVLAVLICLLVGAVIGLINGMLINIIGMFPMIATLATMTILRGVAYLISGGMPIYGLPNGFLFLGQGYMLGIPFPVIIMVLVFIFGYIVLNKTIFGRTVYGIGGNKEASRLSGVSVSKVIYKVYLLQGILGALAGVILLSRINSGQPTAGNSYEMDIITACVLGGTSVAGGEGKIRGVLIGVLFMGVLTNGMVLMDIQDYWQRVVKGLVLILAVALDNFSKKRRNAV
ncbi:ribose transport system permease protein [Aequitasia blattaphilus]|uniref:ABC transporter permease n=1 Tax=Aequitasia blattaphilus TaxID=2949332 RepID=A0ABT1EB14_9FIRM|nr:ABC transporter permease [Aequitasia blattaphilus]MCP1103021.1 ABC transporter permease [Aequitasia blattaphilus]MCR8615661.1 ABC transporter permease [Aequitasia blattaphilus]